MGLIVERLNGDEFRLEDYGVITREFSVDSLAVKTDQEDKEGADGFEDLSTNYEGRTMSGTFLIKTDRDTSYADARDAVFRIFQSRDPFYVVSEEQPERRWLVRASQFTLKRESDNLGTFTIGFTSASPYAESTHKVEYQYTSDFSINNVGDVSIDMVERKETELEFAGVSEGLTIRNKTTGDVWAYNGTTEGSDVIRIKGVRSTLNRDSNSIFGDTNKKSLTFAPGWNDVELTGASDYTLTVRTRFYYI